MLSYRHAYHAGNHADVLKHIVLVLLANYLLRKATPITYIDTHAGAGMYRLDDARAERLGEWKGGIGRLLDAEAPPEAVRRYLSLVKAANPVDRVDHYPGSPWLMRQCLRDGDTLQLFERHGGDLPLLKQAMGRRKRVHCHGDDGFAGLLGLLPPPSRRALVLIDPSYEEKQDYGRVVEALGKALRRFSTGVYAVWYPLLNKPSVDWMKKSLGELPCPWLNVEMAVAAKPSGHGMYGSGMWIANPPWMLAEQLGELLPWLHMRLAPDGAGGIRLDHSAG